MVTLKIHKLDKSLKTPGYAHTGDAGLDLFSSVDCIIEPFKRLQVPTGIKIEIPRGYAGFMQPKSGLAIKNGISLVNTPGLIDSGYRGEVCALLINLDPENTFKISKGDKICQLVIHKVETASIKEVSDLDESSRGTGGFGSTGR